MDEDEGARGEEQGPQPSSNSNLFTSLAAQEALAMLSSATKSTDPAPRVFARVSSQLKEGTGAGGSMQRQQNPEDREAMLAAKERGNELFRAQKEGMREVQAVLQADEGTESGDGEAPATAAAGRGEAAAGSTPPSGSKRQRPLGAGGGAGGTAALRSEVDDWDCSLCAGLLYEPVTTPCGHTFCRECFARAIDHRPRCPYCRTVLHVSRDSLPITITLANIIRRLFPKEYEERRMETTAGGGAGDGDEGGARRDAGEIEDVAVEAEIIECQPQPDGGVSTPGVQWPVQATQPPRHSELDGYRVARCEVLQDTEPRPGTPEYEALPELVAQLDRQVERLLGFLRSHSGPAYGHQGLRIRAALDGLGERPPLEQPERYSFWVVNVAGLVVPELRKAEMLRGTDTAVRLRQLNQQLGGWMGSFLAGGAPGCLVM
ncbi:hypothetical protein VOLCADRAFT_104368 [Volvox carteri f. nagariensis]|uniref:RING-type domain-containing protein n=1 Tax=Volvox carteri f. nagariensis TaxID=3068 RepID=D8TTA5_VOLCA|nr:uncharacterized protein VOLCADRAFT_104368 [Volvox carteri f. nagariensis]EFJ49164.1 hypothetical protein VOLCADRAFT_104368 [Volvox carteri f. nagariensis]|eukprot:XP_002949612.1 hypothetical protein VOLCADRAFT_104368 [Volvox carteri f. nagariensis]